MDLFDSVSADTRVIPYSIEITVMQNVGGLFGRRAIEILNARIGWSASPQYSAFMP